MQEVQTEDAPQAIGPYSQGVKSAQLIFVSGQLPIDPQTNQLVEGDIEKKTNQVIDNLEAVLNSAGSSLKSVLRVDIFLKDLNTDFPAVNKIYASRFCGKVKPARQTVEVRALPLGAEIEMSCIATEETL